ncbi:DUF7405 family protein [Haloarchaeobius salinus]|uniref:DUF7405 family protein n=1 Tax=Haloarchaeobius salinus TaxID=1198298 RepID=UPI00210A7FB5|nr:Tat pathway signal protein [Haloarchaeobius salinus]
MSPSDSRGIDRREFVKSAVAIGGMSALSACLGRFGDGDGESIPTGVDDPTSLPDRQHAWNDAIPTDDHGNHVLARHHVLLYADYAGDGTPTADERETVEAAFRSLERAFEWSNEGLLFTVGYSPRYFDRFEEPLPDSVDLPEPAALTSFEDPELDSHDVVLHLASDSGTALLEAEEALKGNSDTANGVELSAHLGDVLDLPDEFPGRRTGFVGAGLPAENSDVSGIPDGAEIDEDAPLYMGFKSGFEKNQATEDGVTISEGPFAGATTQHISRIRLRLDDWYVEQDQEDRVAEMFCPAHAENGTVEGVGENLGDDAGVDGCAETIEEDARSAGRVGHSQKLARARTDGRPIILRRDFDSTDRGEAGLHFLAVQEGIGDFVETKTAMAGEDLTDTPTIRQRVNNGIQEYTFVKRRGNFLLPPRAHRALPTPRPE